MLLLIATRYILKNKTKSAFIVSLFVILSLNFGHFKNWLTSYETLFDVVDILVFAIYAILIIGGTFYLIKTKRKLDNATIITNSIAIVFVVMILVNIGTYSFEKSFYDETNNLAPNLSLSVSEKSGSPDVYLIILDAYANQFVLQKFFDYDNQEFIDALIEQEFFVPNKYTNSNYPSTEFTITSILNMDYLYNLVPSGISEEYKLELINKLSNNNLVMQNFKAMGYMNIGLDSGWPGARVVDIADENLCDNTREDARIFYNLKQNSVVPSIDLVFSNSLDSQPTQNNLITLNQVDVDHQKRQKILCNFSELPKIHKKFEEPVFVHWHIPAPHTPWVFDSNGDPPLQRSSIMKDVKKRQMAYIGEMEFINKKVIENTKKLISESDNEPIIIILSDHGTRVSDRENTEDEKNIIRYGNLMAFYLPYDVEQLVYETTPVNTFRLIFNSYFNGNYEILEDKVFEKPGTEFTDWEKKVSNVIG